MRRSNGSSSAEPDEDRQEIQGVERPGCGSAPRQGYIIHDEDRSYRAHEHIRVAEKKLGRKIGTQEVVHHNDENKQNNDPENLLVLRSANDHHLIHSGFPVETLLTRDGSHVVVKQQRECPGCLRIFEPTTNNSVFCSLTCYVVDKAKKIPSAEDLQTMVWSKPTLQLAQELGVSDVAIGKWCVKLGIAKPPRGYWVKVKAKKI